MYVQRSRLDLLDSELQIFSERSIDIQHNDECSYVIREPDQLLVKAVVSWFLKAASIRSAKRFGYASRPRKLSLEPHQRRRQLLDRAKSERKTL